MMNDRIFQTIFNEVSDCLSLDWSELVIYLEHGEESYSYSFYAKIEDSFIKCFDLGIPEGKLFRVFENIEKEVSKERKQLDKPWSNMTMVVDCKGNMKTTFDYTDLSSGNYQYKKEWKKKYIG